MIRIDGAEAGTESGPRRPPAAAVEAEAEARLRAIAEDDVGVLPPAPIDDFSGARGFWTGTELLVFTNTAGAAFDPVRSRWRAIRAARNPIKTVLLSGSPTWTGSEVLFVFPGITARYDPARDRWRQTWSGPGFDAERVVLVGRRIVAVSQEGTGRTLLSSTLVPGRRAWRRNPAPPLAFTYPSWPAGAGDELVVVGRTGRPGSLAGHAEAAAFDPRRRAWRALPPAPIPGQAVTAAWNGEEVVAVEYGNEAAALDLRVGTWRALPARPLRTGEHLPLSWPIAPDADGGAVMTTGFTGRAVFAHDAWIPLPKVNSLPVAGADGLELEPRAEVGQLAVRDVRAQLANPAALSVGVTTLTVPEGFSFVRATNPGESRGLHAIIVLAHAGGECHLVSHYTGILPDGPSVRIEPIDGAPSFDAVAAPDGAIAVLVGSDVVTIACGDQAVATMVAAHLSFGRG